MTPAIPNPAIVPRPASSRWRRRTARRPVRRRAGWLPSRDRRSREVLATQTAAPTFSRHALERLQQRGIDLGEQTMQRLTGGIARAADKGSRDSVIFIDGTAFVVSVKNNTVITAVPSERMREHVFTNIDSAVIG